MVKKHLHVNMRYYTPYCSPWNMDPAENLHVQAALNRLLYFMIMTETDIMIQFNVLTHFAFVNFSSHEITSFSRTSLERSTLPAKIHVQYTVSPMKLVFKVVV